MKRVLPILIIGILVFSGISVLGINYDTTFEEKTIIESITISEPIIENNGQYVAVSIEGQTTQLNEPGRPILPVITRVFTFPFGTKINSVDVKTSEFNNIKLSKEVQPALEQVPISNNLNFERELIKDSVVYETKNIYPKENFNCIKASALDKNSNVVYCLVHIYPVRYSPAQNMIYYSDYAEITIKYDEPSNPEVFEDIYDLLIIAPSEYSDELQPLIEHKTEFGIETILKTTEDIYNEYDGYDEAEEIKYFIKDALENWGPKYVLLVGSVDKLPIRTTWIYQRTHNHYWNISILTDLYYSDVYDEYGQFLDWDSDGDGKYGEVYIRCPGVNDTVDLFPDVNIGRLACADKSQVEIVINKIITYETNTFGRSWFNRLLLLGGDTFPGHNGYEGEELNLIIEDIMSDFFPIKLWTSDNTFSFWNINREINKGVGFVDYSGHGFQNGMSTHPPNSNSWVSYNNLHLLGLYNSKKLPIVFFDACLTSKLDHNQTSFDIDIGPKDFDINPLHYLFRFISNIVRTNLDNINFNLLSTVALPTKNNPEPREDPDLVPCFAWNWLIKGNEGGAIATVGATRTAFGGTNSGAGKMSIEFFSAYKSSETVGEMMTGAQFGYIMDVPWDLFTLEEFILLGDPSLKIGGYETKSKGNFP
ncbi:hypothetical protein AYK20_03895 [Thermoplasmatales archaeon SG8-52-1]|nr:MAG: hypothetical protein AYK20_03895 [Thermoplasmatales archaeon SG8-52-1]